jgi:phosphatidate cytidylyltransferase
MSLPGGGVMLLRVLSLTLPAFIVGAAGTWRATRRADPARRRERWIKYAAFFLIVHGVIVAVTLGPVAALALFAPILATGAIEVWRVARSRRTIALSAYAGIALALGTFIWRAPAPIVMFVFVVTATFDGFSQIGGENFGRRPLAPIISPRKTIEGAAGGFLLAIAAGIFLRSLLGVGALHAAAAAGAVCLAALTGDLLASWVKRANGVKDFGRLIPGHGGVLDRFDSFLLAGSGCWLFMLLLAA